LEMGSEQDWKWVASKMLALQGFHRY